MSRLREPAREHLRTSTPPRGRAAANYLRPSGASDDYRAAILAYDHA